MLLEIKPVTLTILHYSDDKSDKIYAVGTYEEMSGTVEANHYVLMTYWGRRGKRLTSKQVLRSQSWTSVQTEAHNILDKKVKKGYENVGSSRYAGPLGVAEIIRGDSYLNIYRELLAPETAAEPETANPDPDLPETYGIKSPNSYLGKNFPDAVPCMYPTFTVIPKQIEGLEDGIFTIGVEYVAMARFGEEFLSVVDNFGNAQVVWADRFEPGEWLGEDLEILTEAGT